MTKPDDAMRAQALRDNLKRRKQARHAAARGRAAQTGAPGEPTTTRTRHAAAQGRAAQTSVPGEPTTRMPPSQVSVQGNDPQDH